MGWFPDQPGGLNRYVRGLVEHERARGGDARLLVVGPASSNPRWLTVAADADEPLAARLAAYARAARTAAAADVDVVDVHFALYALLAQLTGPSRRVPSVVHFHGPWHSESRVSGEPRAAVLAKKLVERAVYRRADEAVVLSRAFGRLLVEQYGISPWRVNVVPPGVDLERFSPGDRAAARRALGLPEDAWIAFSVRRHVPRMGLDGLLAAWTRAKLENALLVVGGDGPLRAELERAAPADARFVGRIDEDVLPAYYRAADVCVVPSRSLEGFGLVALEAAACGTPVIATDVGGLPEAVAGLADDLVVAADDEQALAARLADAAAGTRPLPARAAARAHAERFSWQRTAELHRDVYARAMSGARRRPLRVVYLDHAAALSGGELALLRLLPALEAVDAHVILAQDGPLVRRLEAAGVSVEVLRLTESARSLSRGELARASALVAGSLASAAYALRLARRLRRLSPDLVHANSLKSCLYGATAGRLAGIPVVWHARDRVAEDELGRQGTALVRTMARRLPAAVIANSRATLASLGVARGVVIPSPVLPLPVAADREQGQPFTAGIVGRIARWKGQDIFLEAFARAFPAGRERAVVVGAPLFGADDERYDDELHGLAASLGLNGRVSFTGHVDDVAGQLARLDVLVHASVQPEPFGQVIVEGMEAGVPVVASRAGGPTEIVEDGRNGFLVEPADVNALARTLGRLARDPELRRQVVAQGRASAERFHPSVVATDIERVYRQALGE